LRRPVEARAWTLDPSFSAKKPTSVWNRPLQLDAKGLFGALAKGTVHGFTGQWTELGRSRKEEQGIKPP
jgi:hypothetical protein